MPKDITKVITISFVFQMDAAPTSDTLVPFYQTAGHKTAQDSKPYRPRPVLNS
jgi:hypothetical protein